MLGIGPGNPGTGGRGPRGPQPPGCGDWRTDHAATTVQGTPRGRFATDRDRTLVAERASHSWCEVALRTRSGAGTRGCLTCLNHLAATPTPTPTLTLTAAAEARGSSSVQPAEVPPPATGAWLIPTSSRAGKSHPARPAGHQLVMTPSLAIRPSPGRASCPPLPASASWSQPAPFVAVAILPTCPRPSGPRLCRHRRRRGQPPPADSRTTSL